MTDKREFTHQQTLDLYQIAKSLAASNPDFVVFSYSHDDIELEATVQIPVTVQEMLNNIDAGRNSRIRRLLADSESDILAAEERRKS